MRLCDFPPRIPLGIQMPPKKLPSFTKRASNVRTCQESTEQCVNTGSVKSALRGARIVRVDQCHSTLGQEIYIKNSILTVMISQ